MRVASGGPRTPHDGFLLRHPPVQRGLQGVFRMPNIATPSYLDCPRRPPRLYPRSSGRVPFTSLIIGVIHLWSHLLFAVCGIYDQTSHCVCALRQDS